MKSEDQSVKEWFASDSDQVDRLRHLSRYALRDLHVTGLCPDLHSFRGAADGYVLGDGLTARLGIWRGKFFDEQNHKGVISGTNRIGLLGLEVSRYQFTGRIASSRFRDGDVLFLDHNHHANPGWVSHEAKYALEQLGAELLKRNMVSGAAKGDLERALADGAHARIADGGGEFESICRLATLRHRQGDGLHRVRAREGGTLFNAGDLVERRREPRAGRECEAFLLGNTVGAHNAGHRITIGDADTGEA